MSELIEIELDQVVPDDNNVRRRMDLSSLRELAASIKVAGQLTPAQVQRNGDGKYHLISGHRRLAAMILLADDPDAPPFKLRAEVVEVTSEMQVRQSQLIENIQRQDLDPIDEANGYRQLQDAGLKVKDVAGLVGKAQSHVSKRLSLLKLPESIYGAIRDGYLGLDAAYQLSKYAHYTAEVETLVLRFADEKRNVPDHVIEQLGEKLEFAERRVSLIKALEDRKIQVQDPSTIDTKTMERIEVIPADELPDAVFTEDDIVTVELPAYGHPKITRWGPRHGTVAKGENSSAEEAAKEGRKLEKEARLDRLQRAQVACRRPAKGQVADLAMAAIAYGHTTMADAKDVLNILVIEPQTRVEKVNDRDGNQVEKDRADWIGTLRKIQQDAEVPAHRLALAHLLAFWVRDGNPQPRMREYMPVAAAIGDWMDERTKVEE
jgi:ParB family chromosome partitioning protein